MATTWREEQSSALAAMTPAERARYDAAAEEAELTLVLAELVYAARTEAGLTQKELAQRMGTSQSVISQIEGGAHVPSVPMLHRIARATGKSLDIHLEAS